MRSSFFSSTKKLSAAIVATAFMGSILFAQGKEPNKVNSQPAPDAATRLRIEVTAGEKSSPVDMASVYVRYVIKHAIGRDQNTEMNFKTNKEGVAIASGIPRGRVLVQVIADGWKTFGKWYEATEEEQTIKIHLDKPPKWF